MFFKVNDDEHDNIEKAVETLRMGGTVLYNTTSPRHWVLSCDATDEVAVQKIIAMKGVILPLERMVIVQDEKMLEEFVCPLPGFVRQFLHTEKKDTTVIYPLAEKIAAAACYKDGSVPVRIIQSIDLAPIQMSRHVLRLFGKPLFVTTCTVGENTMPSSYEEINDHIKKGTDLISPLLFGVDDSGELSMIIKYDHEGHITVVRK